MVDLSPAVEVALQACGRSRVMHNDGTPPMVAIRWEAEVVNREDQWITGSGPSHDAAGRSAAAKFARHLRDRGEALIAWAARIEAALQEGRSR